jgi:hypothetical protein
VTPDWFDWRFTGLGFVAGWLAGWWQHHPARERRRKAEAALATIQRTGIILRDEIARIEDALAREKRRGQKHDAPGGGDPPGRMDH